MTPLLERLADAYPDDVRLVYRHFPLTEIHDKAQISAEASEAAGAQGKFWEMHDLLYATHDSWKDEGMDAFRIRLSDFARQIDLDVQQFDADLDSGKFTAKVEAARTFAQTIGLGGTPFILVNESVWPDFLSYLDYKQLDGVVKFFVYDTYPDMGIDSDKQYTADIVTDKGTIKIELYARQAPLAVNSFVYLARQGFYDGAPFHRVIDSFVAQTGDPTGSGAVGAGYTYQTESSPELKYDGPGWVGVARQNTIDTNGSQFFITRAGISQEQQDTLNTGPYTIFGRVLAGQDIVDSLTVRDPQDPNAAAIQPDVVQRIIIEEK